MRADARANREAILESARRLYARDSDVPYSAIAAEAEVGIATLYRHFPTPEDLAAGLAAHLSEQIRVICDRRLLQMDSDPAAGWHGYARDIAGLRLGDLVPHLTLGRPLATIPPEVYTRREEILDSVTRVITAAQAAGLVRHDVRADQVHIGLGMLTRPMPAPVRELKPDLTDWLLEVYLRGLRP